MCLHSTLCCSAEHEPSCSDGGHQAKTSVGPSGPAELLSWPEHTKKSDFLSNHILVFVTCLARFYEICLRLSESTGLMLAVKTIVFKRLSILYTDNIKRNSDSCKDQFFFGLVACSELVCNTNSALALFDGNSSAVLSFMTPRISTSCPFIPSVTSLCNLRAQNTFWIVCFSRGLLWKKSQNREKIKSSW